MFPRISADLLSRVGAHMYPLNFEHQPYFDSYLQCVEERERVVWNLVKSLGIIYLVRTQNFQKNMTISYPPHTYTYVCVLGWGRYVCFSDNFADVLMENC